jgi:hypothetical protein
MHVGLGFSILLKKSKAVYLPLFMTPLRILFSRENSIASSAMQNYSRLAALGTAIGPITHTDGAPGFSRRPSRARLGGTRPGKETLCNVSLRSPELS